MRPTGKTPSKRFAARPASTMPCEASRSKFWMTAFARSIQPIGFATSCAAPPTRGRPVCRRLQRNPLPRAPPPNACRRCVLRHPPPRLPRSAPGARSHQRLRCRNRSSREPPRLPRSLSTASPLRHRMRLLRRPSLRSSTRERLRFRPLQRSGSRARPLLQRGLQRQRRQPPRIRCRSLQPLRIHPTRQARRQRPHVQHPRRLRCRSTPSCCNAARSLRLAPH